MKSDLWPPDKGGGGKRAAGERVKKYKAKMCAMSSIRNGPLIIGLYEGVVGKSCCHVSSEMHVH